MGITNFLLPSIPDNVKELQAPFPYVCSQIPNIDWNTLNFDGNTFSNKKGERCTTIVTVKANCCAIDHLDRNPSMTISLVSVGPNKYQVYLKCWTQNCTLDEMLADVRLTWKDLEATPSKYKVIEDTFSYQDENGVELVQAVRYRKPDATKVCGWRHWDDESKTYIDNKNGYGALLFRLEKLVKAPVSETVYVVEGEKCVYAIESLDLLGVTSGSSSTGKWRQSNIAHYFTGRDVVILPDIDEPGFHYADDVARSLQGIANSVRIVELSKVEKDDICDWIDANSSSDNLVQDLLDIVQRPKNMMKTITKLLLMKMPAIHTHPTGLM